VEGIVFVMSKNGAENDNGKRLVVVVWHDFERKQELTRKLKC